MMMATQTTTAKARTAVTTTAADAAALRGLRATNAWAAALHAAAAVGFGALFASQAASKRTVRLTKTTVDADAPPLNADNAIDFPPKAVPLEGAPFDPAPLVVGFFGVTALAHAAYAADVGGFYSKSVLQRGGNPLRWLEYGISASMMSAIIGGVDGVRDATSLVAAVGATAAMQGQGLIVERALKHGERAEWAAARKQGGTAPPPTVDGATVATATLVGWLLYLVLWIIIGVNFKNVTDDARAAGAPVPNWLGWLVGTQAAFFASFGGVQVAQIAEWRKAEADARAGRAVRVRPFVDYERGYIALSFASKLTLAGILGYGLFQRAEAAGGGSGSGTGSGTA